MSDLVFKQVVRRPFVAEAIEVTLENIHELSDFIGELVQKEGQDPYIRVDRDKVRNRSNVRIGWFMTRRDSKIHCYPPEPFHMQFRTATDEIMDWVDFMQPQSQLPPQPELPLEEDQ